MPARRRKRLLIVSVAALSHKIEMEELRFSSIRSVFPALTCSVQASFRTAAPPSRHGMVANGLFHRTLNRPLFWEQSSKLIQGPRIWEHFRERGNRVAMLFWQQSLGEGVDILLSPAPIHKHNGGMIETCYSKPEGLYAELCSSIGRPFKLRHYWGPLASWKAGEWIVEATLKVLEDPDLQPGLCLTYLPTLDYDLQRKDPQDKTAYFAAQQALEKQLSKLARGAVSMGYDVLVLGEYHMVLVSEAVFPNVALKDASLMQTRSVKGMNYPDFFGSRAFAMTDHEIAHVYVSNENDIDQVKQLLGALPGVGAVLDRSGQVEIGVEHPNSGELLLLAEEGKWFAYPWWASKREAPEFAGHVDIHNKPGYDPCELFFGWPPGCVSRNTSRIRGSHGRTGPGREVTWASTFSFPSKPDNLIELASGVRLWLDQKGS